MKKTLIVLLMLAFVLSGCAKAEQSMDEVWEMPAAEPQYGRPEEEYIKNDEEGYSYDSGSGVEASGVERLVIKNAYLNIAVENPETSMAAIAAMAESMGGYIVSSNLYQTTSNGMTVPQANIQIRVPAEKLDEVMSKVKAMVAVAETGVISETVSGTDVTEDYVDSQSRLKNLQAAEKQLVELLDSATDLQYTLEIFRELTSIRSQIEVLQGHINYLKESAALSALSVDLVAEKTLQPIEIAGWKPKGIAKDAIEALIRALQGIGTGLIWFGIYCLPFLIPLGIAAFFGIKAWRKHRAKKQAQMIELQRQMYEGQEQQLQ